MLQNDQKYAAVILEAIRVSADYLPKFGLGAGGLDLDGFRKLYGSDPFYSWMGLDSPLLYAAHKAAGGMTSIYRQLGIGCERLFRTLLQDTFAITEEEANWKYDLQLQNGQRRTLHLDARIDRTYIKNRRMRNRFDQWLEGFRDRLDVQIGVHGTVFEIRQGYKSKDSKRQNADLANAATAYTQHYLPILLVLSQQLDHDIRIRYETGKWGVLSGNTTSNDPYTSTYAFCREILAYDLEAFFVRNAMQFRDEVSQIVETLLTPS